MSEDTYVWCQEGGVGLWYRSGSQRPVVEEHLRNLAKVRDSSWAPVAHI
jgi:hypothetical protein